MPTPQRINELLRARPVPQSHSVRVGDELDIELPRVPMTAETQFVEFAASLSGQGAIELLERPESLEGLTLPRRLHARAIVPGRSVISINAVDPLSREPVAGVEPLKIVIDIAG